MMDNLYIVMVTVPKGGCCGGDLVLYTRCAFTEHGWECAEPMYNSAIQLISVQGHWDGQSWHLPEEQLRALKEALDERPELKDKGYTLHGLDD